MLPEPLHPGVVHFPIAIAFLIPLAAAWALLAIRRGSAIRRAWTPVAGLAVFLFVAAFASVRTGQAQEDRVEDVVSGQLVHGHEEAAERFLITSGVLLGLAAVGLLRGRLGNLGRGAAAIGSVAALVMVVLVGDSGGKLVYTHGAAAAYASPAPAAAEDTGTMVPGERDDDDGGERRSDRT